MLPTTKTVKTIEAIVKITERCNINCSYCYMFNLGNDDYLSHSKMMSEETVERVAQWLREGAIAFAAKRVRVILHGGEPLLMKKRAFRKMCDIFLARLNDVAAVEFTLQTNAMLVDDDWISLFSQYRISLGVSLDGPQEYNDTHRLDHKGQSTYHETVKGLRSLQKAANDNRISSPGALIVINPKHSGRKIFHHAAVDLGIRSMNFLLPMQSHEMERNHSDAELSDYLTSLSDAYFEVQDDGIKVRIVNQFLSFLVGGKPFFCDEEYEHRSSVQISISSDGHLSPDDELKPLNLTDDQSTVTNTSMFEYMQSGVMTHLFNVDAIVPTQCRECCWQNYCRGGAGLGSLIGRYSTKNGFNNVSVHCNGLRTFFSQITSDALASGVSGELIARALDSENTPLHRAFPENLKSPKRIGIPIKVIEKNFTRLISV